MSEEAIKQQQRKDVRAARAYLDRPHGMFNVIVLNDPDCPFHLERVRASEDHGDETLKVCVTRTASPEERNRCIAYRQPKKLFTKAFLKRSDGRQDFEYEEL